MVDLTLLFNLAEKLFDADPINLALIALIFVVVTLGGAFVIIWKLLVG